MEENKLEKVENKEIKPTAPPFLRELSKNSAEMNKLRAELESTMVNNLTEYEKGLAYGWFLTEMKKQVSGQALEIIKSLMNTGIGFKTDKNPDDPRSKAQSTYSDEIVRNCVVQAIMHGLRIYGNEFNILGGNFYATKEGLYRIVHEYSGLEKDVDYKIKEMLQSPKSGNWQVTYEYSFKKKGEIEVKKEVNLYIKGKQNNFETPMDAIQGKAERKVLKIIYNKLNEKQGFRLEDADDVDDILPESAESLEKSKLSQLGKNIEQK